MSLNDFGVHYCKQIQTTHIKHEAGDINIEAPSGAINIVAADALCLMSPNITLKGVSLNMKCDIILDGSLKVLGDMSYAKLKTDSIESTALTVNGHSMMQSIDISGDLELNGGCNVSGTLQINSSNNNFIVFGDSFEGSWRVGVINGDFHVQKNKCGSWVTLAQWGDAPSP
jgi:hypothetical protein